MGTVGSLFTTRNSLSLPHTPTHLSMLSLSFVHLLFMVVIASASYTRSVLADGELVGLFGVAALALGLLTRALLKRVIRAHLVELLVAVTFMPTSVWDNYVYPVIVAGFLAPYTFVEPRSFRAKVTRHADVHERSSHMIISLCVLEHLCWFGAALVVSVRREHIGSDLFPYLSVLMGSLCILFAVVHLAVDVYHNGSHLLDRDRDTHDDVDEYTPSPEAVGPYASYTPSGRDAPRTCCQRTWVDSMSGVLDGWYQSLNRITLPRTLHFLCVAVACSFVITTRITGSRHTDLTVLVTSHILWFCVSGFTVYCAIRRYPQWTRDPRIAHTVLYMLVVARAIPLPNDVDWILYLDIAIVTVLLYMTRVLFRDMVVGDDAWHTFAIASGVYTIGHILGMYLVLIQWQYPTRYIGSAVIMLPLGMQCVAQCGTPYLDAEYQKMVDDDVIPTDTGSESGVDDMDARFAIDA